MIRLSSDITIGPYKWNGLVNCEVNSSWDNLTDTCTITFPRRVSWKGQSLISGNDPLIKKGVEVEIFTGYDDNNDPSFKGYVTQMMPHVPAEIKCEDEMWKLKQSTITKSYRDVQLKDLLKDVAPGYLFEAPDVRLGPFRINKATPAQVLEVLRKKYFLRSFFRDGTLYVGLAYWPELQEKHLIRFNLHVVEHNLTYQRSEDTKINLKVIVINRDNTKTEYQFGDEDGEQRTLHYYDLEEDEVNHIGDQELERLKYTGYRGELTIFGKPFIRHGDIVKIIDPEYPEREGSYVIKSVVRTFGIDGYRQTITPDIKIA
jgi:hypothetical protein